MFQRFLLCKEPWVQYESEQGIPYYVNNVTGVSQWDNPADEQYKEKIRIIKEKRNKQQNNVSLPNDVSEENHNDSNNTNDLQMPNNLPPPPPTKARMPSLPPPRLELNASDEDDGPYETMENNNIPNNNKINDEYNNNNNNNNVEDNYDGDDGSDNEDDTIEFIAERRVCQDGYVEYKVHWTNTTEEHDEWFPREDLIVEYPKQVEKFESNSSRTALTKSGNLPPDLLSPANTDDASEPVGQYQNSIIDELENEIQEKTTQIRDLEDEAFKYKRQLKRAKRDASDLRKRLDDYKIELRKQDELHETLNDQMSVLKIQLEKEERKNFLLSNTNTKNNAVPPPAPPTSSPPRLSKGNNDDAEAIKLREELQNAKRKIDELTDTCEKKENSLITLNEEVAGLKGDIDRYKMQLEEETKKHAEQRKLLIESENKLLIQGQNHQNDKKQLPPAVVKDIESLRKKSADGEVLIDKLKSELRIQLDKRKLQNEQFTVMRELLAQAQSELKTRAAEVSEIKTKMKTDRETFEKNMDLAEKEKAAEMEKIIQTRLLAARKVADAEIDGVRDELKRTAERLVEEMKQRRKLHNEIMELKGNIRVYCRSRPVNKTEIAAGEENARQVVGMPHAEEGIITVNALLENRQIRSNFEFDASFGGQSTQQNVFKKVQPFVISKYITVYNIIY